MELNHVHAVKQRAPATRTNLNTSAEVLALDQAEPLSARIRWRWAALESRLALWLLGRVLKRRGDLSDLSTVGEGMRNAGRSLTCAIERRLALSEGSGYLAADAGRGVGCDADMPAMHSVPSSELLTLAVAKLHARNLELQQQVQCDALTGLRSRWALEQVLDVACGGQGSGEEPCAVVFADIDHFSSYNKLHGDDRGDQALRTVAQTILSSARCRDYVFRKGGEEILVVLPGASCQEALRVAERMRSAVESAAIPHEGSPTAPVITITVGVSASDTDEGTTLEALMNRAARFAMRAKLACRRNEVHSA